MHPFGRKWSSDDARTPHVYSLPLASLRHHKENAYPPLIAYSGFHKIIAKRKKERWSIEETRWIFKFSSLFPDCILFFIFPVSLSDDRNVDYSKNYLTSLDQQNRKLLCNDAYSALNLPFLRDEYVFEAEMYQFTSSENEDEMNDVGIKCPTLPAVYITCSPPSEQKTIETTVFFIDPYINGFSFDVEIMRNLEPSKFFRGKWLVEKNMFSIWWITWVIFNIANSAKFFPFFLSTTSWSWKVRTFRIQCQ